MSVKSVPDAQLRLEWVYGYRGHQCRNNLFYNASGKIVYFVAGVGIVQQADKQTFFLGHSDDIVSMSLHPQNIVVASGEVGKKPIICIWDSDTTQTKSILKDGHSHGVACLNFSADGKLLVSIGMDDSRMIVVWDWAKGLILSSAKGHNDLVFDAQFSPFEPSVIVSCGVKHVKFWNLSGNMLVAKRGVFGQAGESQTLLCIAFGANQVAYTGTMNGDIYKWQGVNLSGTIAQAHKGAIFTIHSSQDGYITGGKDTAFRLWDKSFAPLTSIDLGTTPVGYSSSRFHSYGSVVHTIPAIVIRSLCWNKEQILIGTKNGEVFELSVKDKANPRIIVKGHAEGELWALAVHSKHSVFATGSDDKTVRLWNAKDHTLIAKVTIDVEVRSVAISPDGSIVAAGLKNGSFAIFSGKDLKEIHRYPNRKEVVHELKFSPDGQYLAVASNDNFVDFYDVKASFKRVGDCKGASSFITHLDFSQDGHFIQTNSGAAERLFHRVPSGERVTKKVDLDTIKWATWTCVLGDDVNGIWEKFTDTNDINAADVYKDTIVTGDDFGKVKIFRYPCGKKGAQSRQYSGHSAHVTNVRFLADHSRIISIGGGDCAIFQWQFFENGTAPAIPSQADSHDEKSDSDNSDVPEVDSDVEREAQVKYDREDDKKEPAAPPPSASKSTSASADNAQRQAPPDSGLALEFVHGYRGYDCRNNMFFLPSQEIIYHIAAAGIVFSPKTRAQRFYLQHTDDILCLGLHPKGSLAATGQIGKEPTIHFWDAITLETKSILKGEHTRGVCAVDFSPDGNRLASIGLDDNHCIVIWEWAKGLKLATARGHNDKIFVIKWNPAIENEVVTVGDKHIKFWSVVGGGLTSKRGTFGSVGKLDTMLCVAFAKDGTCFSGCANGLVYKWKQNNLESTAPCHEASSTGFLTGGKDGFINAWDASFQAKVKSFAVSKEALSDDSPSLAKDKPSVRAVCFAQDAIVAGTSNGEVVFISPEGVVDVLQQGHAEGEVWGLAPHPKELKFVTVSDDKTLRIWSAQPHRLLHLRRLKKAARAVAYSPDGKVIAMGLTDGSIVVIDSTKFSEVAKFQHRKEEISDIKFSPGLVCIKPVLYLKLYSISFSKGKYLAVASHDNFIDIYNVMNSERVGVCKGASSYITHIDWDSSGKIIMVNSGAKEQLFFEAPRGTRQTIRDAAVLEMEWDTWTCVLGKSVSGIWPPSSDVTDVNAAVLSKDKKLLATGDDFGFVKVFSYPATGTFAKFKKYLAHSSHVTNVRWLCDDLYLVSVGGADTSVCVWKNVGKSADGASSASAASATHGLSDDSDTNSDEEGYDSDVQHERNIDYATKIYAVSERGEGSTPVQKAAANKKEETKGKIARDTKQAPLLATSSSRPISGLKLEFVHGYRGFDCRNNIFYLPDGRLVYHTAATGIVLDPKTKTQTFYLDHTDDIISLAINRGPTFGNIVATGQIGKSPIIYIWDASTLKTVSMIKGLHTKGICALDFNTNGKLLLSVSVDNPGTIAIHKWQTGVSVANATGKSRIFVAKFKPNSDTQFVTCGIKHIKFWTLAGSQLVAKRGVLGKGERMQTMMSLGFGPGNITFSGSMSGAIYVWNDFQLATIISSSLGGHSASVFAMFTDYSDPQSPSIITAAKDGLMKVWSSDMKKCDSIPLPDDCVPRSISRSPEGKIILGTKSNDILELTTDGRWRVIDMGHGEGILAGLAMHPSKPCFATASEEKTVCLWDLLTHELVVEKKVKAGASSIAFSLDGNLLATGLVSGDLLILQVPSCNPVVEKRDRKGCLRVVKFSPNNKILAVGSDDETVDFYDVLDGFKSLGFCKGLGGGIVHIDWSADSKYVKVDNSNFDVTILEVPSGKICKAVDVSWASFTSPFSEEALGVWPANSGKADVNCVDVSRSGKAIVSGDDFGLVKLFEFPCRTPGAKGAKYVGHSANVTNVAFSFDDSKVVSIGGDDCSIFVWSTTA